MTRQIKLFVLVLIAIIWFVFILPYFLMQTELGSKYTGQLFSKYSNNFDISIGRVSHSIGKPYELTIENITIQDKQQTTVYLSAKKLIIGLKKSHLLQTQEFDYILIEQGDITLSKNIKSFEANLLQLKNVSLHYTDTEQNTHITLNNVYGGVKPWSNQVISEQHNSQFNLTIQKATYNQFNIQSVFIQGIQKDRSLRLTNVGGNINQGFFTAKASILPDHSIEIGQLKLHKINFQSSIDLLNISELVNELPKTTIEHLSILDSSLTIPNLIIEKGNLEAKNLIYENKWQFQRSDLTFNAQSIIWQDEIIEEPLLQWQSENNTTMIEQAIAKWNKGNIKLTGTWDRDQLVIDNIVASGIRYQLPEDWYQKLSNIQLPDGTPNITIKQFMLMPSLLIDTDPDFPFQFSSFEAFGNNIHISTSDHHLNIEGDVLLKADNATLNTVELKHPDLRLNMLPTNKNFTFSTLIGNGVIEGSAILLPDNQLSPLSLSSYSVNSDILSLWNLLKNPIKTDRFTIELNGQLQPLELNGILKTNDLHYAIKNNQLASH